MNTDSVTFWYKAFFFVIGALIFNTYELAKAIRTDYLALEQVSKVAIGLNIVTLVIIIIVILMFRKKDKSPSLL